MLLVSGATRTVYRYAGHPHIGVLLVPGAKNDVRKIPSNLEIAADNGCFRGFDALAFVGMLERLRECERAVLWVACPDAVVDAEESARLYRMWASTIRAFGFPGAYVLQDGVRWIPWDEIAAVFIGGTTAFKLGTAAATIAQEAKRRGKWVHMGRINSATRIRYAQWIGCDSVDGTSFSRFPDTHIPWALRLLEYEQLRLDLPV